MLLDSHLSEKGKKEHYVVPPEMRKGTSLLLGK